MLDVMHRLASCLGSIGQIGQRFARKLQAQSSRGFQMADPAKSQTNQRLAFRNSNGRLAAASQVANRAGK
jgi:hypothetical protein